MPRIKRWFPVSHDINHSPTMRQLAHDFGLVGWRIWLEILSIADRAGEDIDCTSEGALSRLTSAAETRIKVTRKVIEALLKGKCIATIDEQNHVSRVLNYWEYHRTEERKPRLPDLTRPTRPTRPNKNTKKYSSNTPPSEALEIAQLLSDKIFDNFPNRTAPTESQLTAWARDAEKIKRLDNHSWDDIREMIEWSQTDPFWKANILSMGKLREKWNQLVAKKEMSNGRNNQEAEPKGFAGIRQILKHHA